MYLIFFILAWRGWYSVWVACAISMVSFIIWHLGLGGHAFLMRGLVCFFLGGALFHIARYVWERDIRMLRWLTYVGAVVAWVCVLLKYYADVPVYDLASVHFGVLAKYVYLAFPRYILLPLTILSLVFLEVSGHLNVARWKWIGDSTYAVYLTHLPLQLVFLLLAGMLPFVQDDFYKNIFAVPVFYVALMLISLIIYRKFERPAMKAIRRSFNEK